MQGVQRTLCALHDDRLSCLSAAAVLLFQIRFTCAVARGDPSKSDRMTRFSGFSASFQLSVSSGFLMFYCQLDLVGIYCLVFHLSLSFFYIFFVAKSANDCSLLCPSRTPFALLQIQTSCPRTPTPSRAGNYLSSSRVRDTLWRKM